MRSFAIINTHDNVDISKNIISNLPVEDDLYVFQAKKTEFNTRSNTHVIELPKDILAYGSKVKNFVSKYFFDMNYKGFLHVIEDSTGVIGDLASFLPEVEKMMDMLNLKSWFNTITDPCNYTFNIYNPRFSVDIDEPDIAKIYSKKIWWTSHSNTSWICYDYSKIVFDDIKFDEQFKIPMFYIIKFLAERRNHKKNGELYYMNFYPTIEEELGRFKMVDVVDNYPTNQEDLQKENEVFESMKIDHHPDMEIEKVMDDMVEVIKNHN